MEQAGGIVVRDTFGEAPAAAEHRLTTADRDGPRQRAIERAGERHQPFMVRGGRDQDVSAARRADDRLLADQVADDRLHHAMRLSNQRVAYRPAAGRVEDVEAGERDHQHADVPPLGEPRRHRFADVFRVRAHAEGGASPFALVPGGMARGEAQRQPDLGRIVRIAQEMRRTRRVEPVERVGLLGQGKHCRARCGDQPAERTHRGEPRRRRLAPIDQDYPRPARQRAGDDLAPAGVDHRRPAVLARQSGKRGRIVVVRDDEQSCRVPGHPHVASCLRTGELTDNAKSR